MCLPTPLSKVPGSCHHQVRAPAPRNISKLHSFLGLVNYYGKFLSSLATTIFPLYSLLQKSKRWSWGQSQADAFAEVKKPLLSSQVLVHFDDSLPLTFSCDASPYGIGAVLSQTMPIGDERPFRSCPVHLRRQERSMHSWRRRLWRSRTVFRNSTSTSMDGNSNHRLTTSNLSTSSMKTSRFQPWHQVGCRDGFSCWEHTSTLSSTRRVLRTVQPTPITETRTELPRPAEVVYFMEYLDTSLMHAAQSSPRNV